jgi:hypothetical protein
MITLGFRDIVVYDPPLAENVGRIVEGQTTRDEIVQWFGTPLLSARGAEVVVYRGSPTIQDFAEKLAPLGAEAAQRRVDEFMRLTSYSSLDEDHEVLLYVETLSSSSGYRRNKLLVMLDVATRRVERYWFSEEFQAP